MLLCFSACSCCYIASLGNGSRNRPPFLVCENCFTDKHPSLPMTNTCDNLTYEESQTKITITKRKQTQKQPPPKWADNSWPRHSSVEELQIPEHATDALSQGLHPCTAQRPIQVLSPPAWPPFVCSISLVAVERQNLACGLWVLPLALFMLAILGKRAHRPHHVS